MRVRSKLFFGIVIALAGSGMIAPTMLPAQANAAQQPATVPAVMLSDLHLDPFHDPAKVPLLVKASLPEWEGILASPDSPTQQTDFAAVQDACKAKESFDTPYALLSSSLNAAKLESPGARFVVVSGDLLVHDLDCRYRAALKLPKAKGDDQSLSAAFAEKTTNFVINLVEKRFKGLPVYFALGNNDSRCNHNRLDVGDAYLKATGQSVIDGLVGIGEPERKQALATYESAGYYAVTMADPMLRTRLLVVDDIYMMSKFANCEADDSDHKGAEEQMTWLTKELDGARQRGERVWVLGHVPPEVDVFNSLVKGNRMCGSGHPEAYLSSDDLANVLSSHADVVRLAIFGHTHMDELLLLGSRTAGVPVKVIASISPVVGNTPSFAVAKVAPAAAELMDYTVYEASNKSGSGTTWAKEYAFDETYHEPNFSASSLGDLIGRLRADNAGTSAESQAYERFYFKGAGNVELGPFWSMYACSLDHPTADGFKACVCGK